MTSGTMKKKRKAAKRKKKKLLHNKNKYNKGINIHSPPPTNIQGEDGLERLIQEEIGSSSVGLVLESKFIEGSGIMEKPETEAAMEEVKKEEQGVVGDFQSEGDIVNRNVSIECVEETEKESGDGVDDIGRNSREERKWVEKIESLETEEDWESLVEAVPHVDLVDKLVSERVAYDPIEKVISVSEETFRVFESENVIEPPQKGIEDKFVQSQVVEDIPIERTKDLDVLESISKESEDKAVASLDAPRVETSNEIEEPKHCDSIQSSQNQANVPYAPPMLQRTTWKSCCGLFEVLTGSNK